VVKLKEGIFTGPQIRKLLYDEIFDQFLRGKEKAARNAHKCSNRFLG